MPDKIEIIIGAKDEFSKAFGKLRGSLPSVKTLAVGAGAAIAGMGAAMFASAKATADAYDKVQKFSDQLGISTEFISKMGAAAEFSGVKQETMNKSLQKLTVNIGEASRGMGQGKDALEALGIELQTTSGQLKTAEQIMPELADAFGNMANATERAEAASKIFGQRGMEMLQMMKGGSAGLAEMTGEAERFGLVVSAKAGANAAEFNDSLTRVSMSLKGLRNAMAEQTIPLITGLANRFADFAADNRDRIINFAETFMTAMGNLAEKGAYAVAILVDAWRGLQMTWEVLKMAFAGFSSAMFEGIGFLTEKLLAFMEKLNFRGVFDDAIAKVQGFEIANEEAIAKLTEMGQTAYDNLNAIVDQGSAVGKVKEFTGMIKEAIAEIRASGQAEVKGIAPFTDANLEKTRENIEVLTDEQTAAIENLRELHNEYFLTEAEQLDLWYEEQLEKYAFHNESLFLLDEMYQGKKKALEAKAAQERDLIDKKQKKLQDKKAKEQQQTMVTAYSNMATAMKSFGKTGFKIWKAMAIAETVVNTYKAAMGAYSAMSSIPIIGPILGAVAAAAAIAFGLSQVQTIRSQQPAAHGGLEYVPKEQTYLLDRGERVLSPQQNRDLVDFMDTGEGGGRIIVEAQHNYFEVLPNATAFEALHQMSKEDWRDLAEDNIIPALREMKTAGIVV